MNSTLFQIFSTFFRIGLFTFGGGYAMIPLIRSEVIDKRHWVEGGEFLELLTLAQSAPGPIALNTSVFVGYKIRGYRGALAAILGVVIPSFVIILVVALFFRNIKDNPSVAAALEGMRPAVIALIIIPAISLGRELKLWGVAVAAVVALLIWYVNLSPVYFILGAFAVGALYPLVKTLKRSKK